MAECARHNKIGTHFACFRLYGVGDGSSRNVVQPNPLYAGAMVSEVLNHVLWRKSPIPLSKFLWIYGEHGNLFGALDER